MLAMDVHAGLTPIDPGFAPRDTSYNSRSQASVHQDGQVWTTQVGSCWLRVNIG